MLGDQRFETLLQNGTPYLRVDSSTENRPIPNQTEQLKKIQTGTQSERQICQNFQYFAGKINLF